MSNVAFYRLRETGALVSAKAVRQRALDECGYLHVAKPENWSEEFFDRVGADPVYGTAQPEHDSFSQQARGRYAERMDGGWVQMWVITSRFSNVDEERKAVLRRLHRIADEKRDAGITVEGIPIRTDLTGITRITGAELGSMPERRFVTGEGESVTLTALQVANIFQHVDDHVQGCFDRWAELIHEVNVSDSPASVDLTAGWPSNE